MMKVILLGLALLAVALAAPASKETTGAGQVKGNINLDLFGESSVKHNIGTVLSGLKDALKLLGLEGALSGDHKGIGKLQAGLDFVGERKPNVAVIPLDHQPESK